MENYQNELIVIKVGTSTLEREAGSNYVAIHQDNCNRIGLEAQQLMLQGAHIAIVSSGAIAMGYYVTGEKRTHQTRADTVEKQRLACIGQASLMGMWSHAFRKQTVDKATYQRRNTGQLLFTKHELETDEGRELLRVSERMIIRGDIIVANENDALSHDEIKLGDNDTLAARFASILHTANLFKRTRLMILSDIHGVYANKDDASTVIKEITDIDALQSVAGGAGSIGGTGGMATKFDAARICQANDIDMYIAYGRTANTIQSALLGRTGTRFTAKVTV